MFVLVVVGSITLTEGVRAVLETKKWLQKNAATLWELLGEVLFARVAMNSVMSCLQWFYVVFLNMCWTLGIFAQNSLAEKVLSLMWAWTSASTSMNANSVCVVKGLLVLILRVLLDACVNQDSPSPLMACHALVRKMRFARYQATCLFLNIRECFARSPCRQMLLWWLVRKPKSRLIYDETNMLLHCWPKLGWRLWGLPSRQLSRKKWPLRWQLHQ